MVLLCNTPLLGPPPREIFEPVPRRDYVEALVHGTGGLLQKVESDTCNVVLTLARIWSGVVTDEGRFLPNFYLRKVGNLRLEATLGVGDHSPVRGLANYVSQAHHTREGGRCKAERAVGERASDAHEAPCRGRSEHRVRQKEPAHERDNHAEPELGGRR